MPQLRSLLRRPSPALVVACAALFLLTGGTATAGVLWTGAQVADGTLTGADVEDGSLTTADLDANARAGRWGRSVRAVAGDVFLPRGSGLDRRTLLDLPGFARLNVTHCTYRTAEDPGAPLPGEFETGAVTLTNTSSTALNVRAQSTAALVQPGGTIVVGASNTTDLDLVLRSETARSPHASIDLDTLTTAGLDCMHTATGVFDARR